MLIKNLIDAACWRFSVSDKAFAEGGKTADEGIYTYILLHVRAECALVFYVCENKSLFLLRKSTLTGLLVFVALATRGEAFFVNLKRTSALSDVLNT